MRLHSLRQSLDDLNKGARNRTGYTREHQIVEAADQSLACGFYVYQAD